MQLRNPVQLSEFIDDGQIVVDVIATDASGEVFQVEMQSWNHAAQKELYKAQLEKGDKYTELRPVVSIWLMDENTFRGAIGFHHRFRVRDDAGVLELSVLSQRFLPTTIPKSLPLSTSYPEREEAHFGGK